MAIHDLQFVSDLLPLPEPALPGPTDLTDPTGSDLPVALAEARDQPDRPAAPTVAPAATEPEPERACAPPADGLVARFRRRLFNPLGTRSGKADVQAQVGLLDLGDLPPAERLPKAAPTDRRRDVGFKASLAEFLLINRLRARIRPKAAQPVQSADVLQRAEKIIYVTCKDWFGEGDSRSGDLGTRL